MVFHRNNRFHFADYYVLIFPIAIHLAMKDYCVPEDVKKTEKEAVMVDTSYSGCRGVWYYCLILNYLIAFFSTLVYLPNTLSLYAF